MPNLFLHVFSLLPVGKCEPRGILMGSNAALMSVEFDQEVSSASTFLVFHKCISRGIHQN